MIDPYETLGIDRDADPAAIKQAHRRAVRRAHPDRGGKREDFEVVQRAWLVLSDPVKRKRYDRTGRVDDDVDNSLAARTALLVGAFDRAIAEGGYENRDVIASMKRFLRDDKCQAETKAAIARQAAEKTEKLAKRLSFTGAGVDPIARVLDERLKGHHATAEQMADVSLKIDDAVAALDHYGWSFTASADEVLRTRMLWGTMT